MFSRISLLISIALMLFCGVGTLSADTSYRPDSKDRASNIRLTGTANSFNYRTKSFEVSSGRAYYTVIADRAYISSDHVKTINFDDLRAGDVLSITGVKTSEHAIIADRIELSNREQAQSPRSQASYQRNIDIEGDVTGVDNRRKEFGLSTDNGNYTVITSPYIPMGNSSNTLNISKIRVGDRVRVAGSTDRSNVIIANDVRVIHDRHYHPRDNKDRDNRHYETIEGKITKAANMFSRTIVIQYRGGDVSIDVTNDADVRRDGQKISMHDLKSGETVKVSGTWSGSIMTSDSIEVVRYYNTNGHYNRDDNGKSYRP